LPILHVNSTLAGRYRNTASHKAVRAIALKSLHHTLLLMVMSANRRASPDLPDRDAAGAVYANL